MSEQDIKKLQELALEKLRKGVTREEALKSLILAGILDDKGNYTKPYKNLATIMPR